MVRTQSPLTSAAIIGTILLVAAIVIGAFLGIVTFVARAIGGL